MVQLLHQVIQEVLLVSVLLLAGIRDWYNKDKEKIYHKEKKIFNLVESI